MTAIRQSGWQHAQTAMGKLGSPKKAFASVRLSCGADMAPTAGYEPSASGSPSAHTLQDLKEVDESAGSGLFHFPQVQLFTRSVFRQPPEPFCFA